MEGEFQGEFAFLTGGQNFSLNHLSSDKSLLNIISWVYRLNLRFLRGLNH